MNKAYAKFPWKPYSVTVLYFTSRYSWYYTDFPNVKTIEEQNMSVLNKYQR